MHVVMFTILNMEILIQVLLPVLHLKICLMTGYVLNVVLVKMSFRRKNELYT